MRFTNKAQIDDFLATANACEGHVWLESIEGDRFNLKSSFSQYVALGALLSDNGENLELFCQLPEDRNKFIKFFHDNPGVN